MARRMESLLLAGPAGKLEALLEEPADVEPVEAALVCHPHPQFGGTMHTKAVYRLARGLRKSACVVLRFHYRGVNLSEGSYDHGVGELEDARFCLNELRHRYPDLPVLAGGFSFGSRIALHLAAEETAVKRVIAAGFPTRGEENDSFVNRIRVPRYFVQSTNDVYGPFPEFTEFYQRVNEPKHLDWIESADHFFHGALDAYEDAVVRIGNLRLP